MGAPSVDSCDTESVSSQFLSLCPDQISVVIGAPFLREGRTPEGWDCWGLVWWTYREWFCIEIDPLIGATPEEATKLAAKQIEREWIEEQVHRLGNVLLLRMGKRLHVGLLVDNERMLHVLDGPDTCLERISSSLWERRILGQYRCRGLPSSFQN